MYKNASKLVVIIFTNMIRKIKSVKCNHFAIINSEKFKLHIKAVKTMRDAAILVLLHRPLRNAVTFCILEKTREPTTTEERLRVQ